MTLLLLVEGGLHEHIQLSGLVAVVCKQLLPVVVRAVPVLKEREVGHRALPYQIVASKKILVVDIEGQLEPAGAVLTGVSKLEGRVPLRVQLLELSFRAPPRELNPFVARCFACLLLAHELDNHVGV